MRKVKTFSFFDIARGGKDLISMPMDEKYLYDIQKFLLTFISCPTKNVPKKATALL